MHSFDAKEDIMKQMIKENKKITIVGGRKTATDFVLNLYKYGYKFD